MKKRGNIIALVSFACGLLLTSCGGSSNKEYSLTIEKDSGVSAIEIYNDDSKISDLTHIEEGTELRAVITLVDGYVTTAVTLNDNEVSVTNGTYLFEMPKENSVLEVKTSLEDGGIIINNDNAKGTYLLSVNGETSSDNKFKVGDEITIKITPNSGYKVSSFKLDEEEVTLVDGSYSFEATKLTYTINIEYTEGYKVYIDVLNEPNNDFYESVKAYVNNDEITSKDYLENGTEIKLVLKAAENQEFRVNEYINTLALLYVHVNNDVYLGDDESVASLSSDHKELTYTFKIESEDLNIKIAYNSSTIFGSSSVGSSFIFEKNDNVDVYGYSVNETYDASYFTPTLVRKPGYKVTSFTLTDENGTKEVINESQFSLIFKNNVSQNFSLSSDLTGKITIKIDGEEKAERKISYVGLDDIKVTSGLIFDTSLIAGETVSMGGIVAADGSKYIKDIKFDGVEGVLPEQNTYDLSWSYNFVMPENDVTIEFVLDTAYSLDYTKNENIEKVEFRSSSSTSSDNIITTGIPGQSVYAFIYVKEGYLLSKVTDQDGNELEIAGTDYNSEIPYVIAQVGDDGLTLTIEVNKSYSVSASAETEKYVTTVLYSETAAAGSTFQFSYYRNTFTKSIKEVYLTDTSGNRLNIKLTDISDEFQIGYSFIMPETDVIICYDLEDAVGYETKINITSETGEDVNSLIEYLMIRNINSNVNISEYKDGMVASLFAETDTQIQLSLTSGYTARASFTYVVNGQDKTEEIEISYVGGGDVLFKSFYTPAGIKSIDVVIYKEKALNATINHDESLTDEEFSLLDITYELNNEEVDSFIDKVYAGDQINIIINTKNPDGYTYLFEIKDSNGNPIESSYYGYRINGDFTITFKKVKTYSFTIKNESSLTYVNCYLDLSNNDRLNDGDNIVGDNLTGYFSFIYLTSPIDYVVTIGGVEVTKGSVTTLEYGAYYGESESFTINGDVVITITDYAQ